MYQRGPGKANQSINHALNRIQSRHQPRKVTSGDGWWFSTQHLLQVLERLRSKGGQAPGPDGITHGSFNERQWTRRLRSLGSRIRRQVYVPGPTRKVSIPKANGKTRTIEVPNLLDKVAARACMESLSEVCEGLFADWSFGYRPGRSHVDLLENIQSLYQDGCVWVSHHDVKDAFNHVNLRKLRKLIRELPVSQTIRALADSIVQKRGLKAINDGQTGDSGMPPKPSKEPGRSLSRDKQPPCHSWQAGKADGQIGIASSQHGHLIGAFSGQFAAMNPNKHADIGQEAQTIESMGRSLSRDKQPPCHSWHDLGAEGVESQIVGMELLGQNKPSGNKPIESKQEGLEAGIIAHKHARTTIEDRNAGLVGGLEGGKQRNHHMEDNIGVGCLEGGLADSKQWNRLIENESGNRCLDDSKQRNHLIEEMKADGCLDDSKQQSHLEGGLADSKQQLCLIKEKKACLVGGLEGGKPSPCSVEEASGEVYGEETGLGEVADGGLGVVIGEDLTDSEGISQGNSLSGLLFNVYLHHHHDKLIGDVNGPKLRVFRYADNFIVVGADKSEVSKVARASMDLLGRAGMACVQDEPVDLNVQSMELLGLTAKGDGLRINYDLTESAWTRLDQRLDEALNTPSPSEQTNLITKAWTRSSKPVIWSVRHQERMDEILDKYC